LARLLERVDAVVSVVIGLLNGIVIAALDLPPILVTLAMLSIVRGSALLLGGPDMHSIRGQPAYSFIGTGNILGIPFSVYLFAGLAALMLIIQKHTTFGLMVAALETTNAPPSSAATARAGRRRRSTRCRACARRWRA
jgi:ribose/xylose/arabinose/galactoside ABC-type transport system permease subunit